MQEAQLTYEVPEGATAQRAGGFNDSNDPGLPGSDRYPDCLIVATDRGAR